MQPMPVPAIQARGAVNPMTSAQTPIATVALHLARRLTVPPFC